MSQQWMTFIHIERSMTTVATAFCFALCDEWRYVYLFFYQRGTCSRYAAAFTHLQSVSRPTCDICKEDRRSQRSEWSVSWPKVGVKGVMINRKEWKITKRKGEILEEKQRCRGKREMGRTKKKGREQDREQEGKQRGGSWIEKKHDENPNNLLFFLRVQEQYTALAVWVYAACYQMESLCLCVQQSVRGWDVRVFVYLQVCMSSLTEVMNSVQCCSWPTEVSLAPYSSVC